MAGRNESLAGRLRAGSSDQTLISGLNVPERLVLQSRKPLRSLRDARTLRLFAEEDQNSDDDGHAANDDGHCQREVPAEVLGPAGLRIKFGEAMTLPTW